jgi:diguanylate cyclase (GGDEF)-like protein
MTGAGVLLALAAAQAIIGAGRFVRIAGYREHERAGMSRAGVLASDRALALWSALYALGFGLICYELVARAKGPDAFALASAVSTGYALGFAMTNAGRPRTLRLQLAALAGPQIPALLMQPALHGSLHVGLLIGLVGGALALGRHEYERLVALFRVDEANRRLARCDMLTGLMNRFAFTQAFAAALAAAQGKPGETIAIYLVDLDRFKEINDTLGHEAGDAVIVETARRLEAAAGAQAARVQINVARMGGDEFMLIARGQRSHEIAGLGKALIERLSHPLEIGGVAVTLAGSVGVAVYPGHGRDMAELMRHADCALYEAKREGRGRFRLFDETLQFRLAEERLLESELDTAMREDEIEVWYQPIRSLKDGALGGYEALVRWRHPTRGVVAADGFVSLAEQNGAIHRLGEIVLEKACREAAGWGRRASLCVNLSPQQFLRPEPLVASVKRALALSGLEPERLYLEITESLLMEDTPRTRRAINELADHGVRFSLDDFGAGYSSLGLIQNYPFSKIKIDGKFVRDIHVDRVSSAIVASVCALAQRIGMEVVAEGVETLAQQRALVELGVDLAQGFLYGHPAPMARHLSAQEQSVA